MFGSKKQIHDQSGLAKEVQDLKEELNHYKEALGFTQKEIIVGFAPLPHKQAGAWLKVKPSWSFKASS